MKAILSMLMLLLAGGLFLGAGGCASSQYTAGSYNQPKVMQEYINNHPDYYQSWQNDIPSG